MGAGHDHGHSHGAPVTGTAAAAYRGRLRVALGITITVMVVEVVGGLLADSLALIADAAHMATDALGLGMALLAIHFANRPATGNRTFGYARAGDPRRARQLPAAARRRRLRPVRGGPAVHHARRHRGRADHRVRPDRPGREHDLPHAAGARPEGEPERAGRLPGGRRGRAGLPRGDHRGRGDPDHWLAGRRPHRLPRHRPDDRAPHAEAAARDPGRPAGIGPQGRRHAGRALAHPGARRRRGRPRSARVDDHLGHAGALPPTSSSARTC